MKVIKIIIIIFILSPYCSYSDEYKYKHVIPSNSPLAPTKCSYSGPHVCFSGKVVVKAKYKFIYDLGSGLPHNPYMLIYPDKSSIEMLPYLTERNKDEKCFEIMIHNPEEVALMLFDTKLAEKISKGAYSEVSGEAEFLFNEFGATYECDSPFYWTNISGIKKIITPHKFIEPLSGISNESLIRISPNISPHQLLDKEYKLEIIKEFPISDKELSKINFQGCSWYCCGNTINAKASSSLATTKNEITYSPQNVCDLKLNTAWVEGKNGYGIGEFIEFEAIQYPFHTIEIYNGYSKSLKTWNENSRVKVIKLYMNNHPLYILELKDTYQLQSFRVGTLNNNKETVRLKFEIVDIYPGEKYKDTAITDLNLNFDQHCH